MFGFARPAGPDHGPKEDSTLTKNRSSLLENSGTIRPYGPVDYLTALTIASNACGSFIARSASTLRLSWMPLALSLPINCE